MRYGELPRIVVCLKCTHEAFAPDGFPRRCFGCGASSDWLVAPPDGLGRYAAMIVRLAEDPAVAAKRATRRRGR